MSLIACFFRRAAMSDSARRGTRGEKLARTYLRRNRYRVLRRNLRTPLGEADIVALAPDRRTIVIVEVKTRAVSTGLASPGERAITHAKKQRLIRLTQLIARKNNWLDRPLRIDVIAIDEPDSGKPVIRHHPRAVTLRDR